MHKIVLLTLMAIVCSMAIPAGAGEAPDLILPLPQGRSTSHPDSMLVGIDFAAIDPTGKAPAEIRITLPDRTITARRQRVERRGVDDYSWRGTVQGFELSTVVLTVSGKTIFGHIDFAAVSYVIETVGGEYIIAKKDLSRRGPLGDDIKDSSKKRGK